MTMSKDEIVMSILCLCVSLVLTVAQKGNVNFTKSYVRLQTASCAASFFVSSNNTSFISMELHEAREKKGSHYLARVSVRNSSRKEGEERDIAARHGTKPQPFIDIGLIASTSLDLRHDDVTCKYTHHHGEGSIDTETNAKTATYEAKMFEYTFPKNSHKFQSARIEVKTAREVFEFDSAKQPIHSLEFYKSQDRNDPTLFLWLEKDDGLRLQVCAQLNSELAANADNYDCHVKIGDRVTECEPYFGIVTESELSSPMPSPYPSGSEFPGRAVAFVLVCLVVLLAVLAVPGALYFRRKTKGKAGADVEQWCWSKGLLENGDGEYMKGGEEEKLEEKLNVRMTEGVVAVRSDDVDLSSTK
ncbi:uncharacterized protein [Littorina saxatilis]|uniref:Uncharacterized protein n=1 Tax=Littorina saxatilis TaxID=31220 RepID=A0AAN9AKU8_9CAEN